MQGHPVRRWTGLALAPLTGSPAEEFQDEPFRTACWPWAVPSSEGDEAPSVHACGVLTERHDVGLTLCDAVKQTVAWHLSSVRTYGHQITHIPVIHVDRNT